MPNTKDHRPADHGLLISVLGGWGTGKSWFACSAAEHMTKMGKKTALAVLLSGELNSYAGLDIDYEEFDDPDWRPTEKSWIAGGYNKLLVWLRKVEQDKDVGLVIIDPGTEITHLIMHAVLQPVQQDDPKAAGEYGAAYLEHDRLYRYFMDTLGRIQRSGKHVICTGHTRMKELEGAGDGEMKNVMGTVDLHFDEKQLPALLSNDSRQSWGKYFSLLLYSYTEGTNQRAEYYVRSVPSKTAPAKARVPLKLPQGMSANKMPNDFGTIVQAVRDGAAG